MDGGVERSPHFRAHRRLRIGASVVLGTAVGIGLGSLAVLADTLWPLAVLALPLGFRVVGTVSGRMTVPNGAVGWLWPVVALAVAMLLVLLLPPGIAPFGLAIAVALWITAIIAAGILDVVVDPEGRMGGL